jgi:hypothetical protein
VREYKKYYIIIYGATTAKPETEETYDYLTAAFCSISHVKTYES